MISIQNLYNMVVEDRMKTLDFFKRIDKGHFHRIFTANTWSPELIFRHLLTNIQWILDKLPSKSKINSNIAINLEEEVTIHFDLKEIINEFERISPLLKKQLSLLTPEQEEEYIEMWKGKMKRRTYIIRLINHEHRHLGQIQWLLKRLAGWTDNDIYS